MIIFGIDPGYGIIGYGVIEKLGNKYNVLDYGVVTTPAKTDLSIRLNMMYDEIDAKIKQYNPDCIAIEELFFNKNITTAIAVAQARGALVLCATKANKKIYEYTPLQIKQAITGYGRADKGQMQRMVQILLNLTSIPKPDDAADALAAALCCGNSERFSS
ncbi:MAG: crossover junction endodeoxyribonuclease RuvC [Clostridia bacterium]|nr:crossover junction endodeoxyribonuclease RuvC [Clostridia bacterium]